MSYYDEEFYNEPSEFEQEMDTLRQSLLKSVKDEFIEEMDALRKENAELQQVKRDFGKIKMEYFHKEQALIQDKNKIRQEVRRERLDALMVDFRITTYRAYSKRVTDQKCNECNSIRHRTYITPLGKEASEECTCATYKIVYSPEEYTCSEFKINRDVNGMSAFYKIKDEEYAVHDSSIHADSIYKKSMNYSDLKRYNTFFNTKEECQKYCDWLNLPKATVSTESA